MKKQTAVEWLEEAMSNKLSSEIGPYFLDLFEQAKAIEKEQIVEAYAAAIMKENNSDYIGMNEETSGEIYYNQTYGQ
jgi:hypothetical protein